jgi:hypothetical protein
MFYSWLVDGKGAGALTDPCRFPPPWTIEDLHSCFVVADSNRQKLAYVFYEEEPGPGLAATMLSKDEARQIAANFAKLPELLRAKA